VLADAKRARDAFGRPVIFVSVISERSEPPDADARKKMTARLDELFDYVDTGFAVVEGTSVGSVLKRTLARTMMTLSRRRTRLRVVASFDELFDQIGDDVHATRADVIATAAELARAERRAGNSP
jgi:hypothetical protein